MIEASPHFPEQFLLKRVLSRKSSRCCFNLPGPPGSNPSRDDTDYRNPAPFVVLVQFGQHLEPSITGISRSAG